MRTGWVCSHVLATLSLQGHLDIEATLQRLPVRRAPGRPPTRGTALTRDDALEGYFTQARLTRLFVRRPGTPLNWRIVDDFEVRTPDGVENANFAGTVVSMRLTDGVYVWSARFDDGDMRDYEADELATAAERAHQLGVSVAP